MSKCTLSITVPQVLLRAILTIVTNFLNFWNKIDELLNFENSNYDDYTHENYKFEHI